MKNLEDFLRPTQKHLFKRLAKKFKGKTLISKGNFILVHGQAPVMLVAHLDTVHEQPVRDICLSADCNIIMSPQGIGGDDRCGVFALSAVTKKSAGLELNNFASLISNINCLKKSTTSNSSLNLTAKEKMTLFSTVVTILI